MSLSEFFKDRFYDKVAHFSGAPKTTENCSLKYFESSLLLNFTRELLELLCFLLSAQFARMRKTYLTYHKKTCFLHIQKQRRRSAARLPRS